MKYLGILSMLLAVTTHCFAQDQNEAHLDGLRGPIRSVLTESSNRDDDPNSQIIASVLVLYDRDGFRVDEFRYAPDGSVQSHTKYTRKEWQVFKNETTSIIPNENRMVVTHYNADGLLSGTETYDGSGVLLSKTTTNFSRRGNQTVARSQERTVDGRLSASETIENTDPATGITTQTIVADGKQQSKWVIQRDPNGMSTSDTLASSDGSFNSRETKPDGTVVEHRYWAPSKTHTYQVTDAQNNVLEVIEDSPSNYSKTTFRYDKAGRRVEIANYDRSGKLFQKGKTEYQDDNYGNWIESTDFNWSKMTKRWKGSGMTRRIITYY